jgi:hypothetical protein
VPQFEKTKDYCYINNREERKLGHNQWPNTYEVASDKRDQAWIFGKDTNTSKLHARKN